MGTGSDFRKTILVQSNQTKFYLGQAAEARTKLETATLQNVRDNLERCAEAWDVLAVRSSRSDRLREAEADRKLEQQL